MMVISFLQNDGHLMLEFGQYVCMPLAHPIYD